MSRVVVGLKVRTWLILLALVAVVGLLTAGSIDRYAVGQQGARTSASAGATSEEAKDYARTLSKAFRETSEQVLPSVVAIFNQPAATRTSDRMSPSEEDEDDSEGTPFEDMFRFHPELRRFFRDMPSMPRMPRPGGVGSGVIIDAKGVILTNNHVVAGGGKITVRLQDGREFEAAEVKGDPKTDVAVVRIKGADNLKPAKLGDSDKMAVGDWVLALGDPFGLEGTVTAGIISAKGRAMGIADRESFLQTDAAINPGNSGGPLLDRAGRVVGVNTAILSESRTASGVGFAIPSNTVRRIVPYLIAEGSFDHSWLG
ncbi:MAG: trypsin-like peptidase domain-containing protein, partial [Thermoguttaceae bacterium]|nr:trypsin-like peptidase domain-containing protein [Thermoguttaceae bacterium]